MKNGGVDVNHRQLKQAACRYAQSQFCMYSFDFITSHVWLVDGSPADIFRSDSISEAGETATDAGEGILVWTVTFIHTPADWAGSAGISGVDQDNRNAMQFSFIGDLLPEVEERPGVVLSPLSLADRYPVSDPLKVFQGYSPTGVFRSQHQLFGDSVVDILGKTALFPLTIFEQLPGRLRSFCLQLAPQAGVPVTQTVDLFTRVVVPIAVGGDVVHPHINPQEVRNFFLFWGLDIASSKQVEHAINQNQVALAALPVQVSLVPLTAHKWNTLAIINRPDRDHTVIGSVGEDTVIVGNCAVRLELPLLFLPCLVRIRYFRDAAHNHLSAQRKLLPHFSVCQLVQWKLPERFVLPCPLANVTADSVSFFKCPLEKCKLLLRGKKFYLSDQFHSAILAHLFYHVHLWILSISTIKKPKKKGGRWFPLPPKGDSLHQPFL